ncbi:protein kinase rio1 [Tulasnella sp. 403]|nr:protein kinase rio1 [Tulasnella sp. 403]
MEGQFDDAQDVGKQQIRSELPSSPTPHKGHAFTDDDIPATLEQLLLDDLSEEDAGYSSGDYEEDEIRVEDEDWEIADKDFTKQFNRLRQHAAILNGMAFADVNPSTQQRSTRVAVPVVNTHRAPKPHANDPAAKVASNKPAIETDQLALLQKYNARISNIDEPYNGLGLAVSVNPKGPSATANRKDKSDRATSEQANVYHAFTPDRKHLAVKIYKTSILVFKDRDRYVTGEFRFRRGYARKNPRKMVRLWAEKEMRNLKRLTSANVRCPEPIEVRENVLVMGFLGSEDGWASPRLKDATIAASEMTNLYIEILVAMRRMYHSCKLVHADLSEYNVLYHNGHLYIIDVSQSVEHDHPHAFDFLRSDITNIEEFWGKRDVKTLGLRRTFDFIVSDGRALGLEHEETRQEAMIETNTSEDASATPNAEGEPEKESVPSQSGMESIEERKYAKDASYLELERVLHDWLKQDTTVGLPVHHHGEGDIVPVPAAGLHPHLPSHRPIDAAQEDAVFRSSFIPRNLGEVVDPERDIDVLNRGEGDTLIYGNVTGVVKLQEANKIKAQTTAEVKTTKGADPSAKTDAAGPQGGSAEVLDEESSSATDDDSDDDAGEHPHSKKAPRGHRHEDREAKKARQRAVKEQNRERRKAKMPKAEKQQKIKKTKQP